MDDKHYDLPAGSLPMTIQAESSSQCSDLQHAEFNGLVVEHLRGPHPHKLIPRYGKCIEHAWKSLLSQGNWSTCVVVFPYLHLLEGMNHTCCAAQHLWSANAFQNRTCDVLPSPPCGSSSHTTIIYTRKFLKLWWKKTREGLCHHLMVVKHGKISKYSIVDAWWGV